MVDIPASTATTRTIAFGGTTSDSLEIAGDHDWFRIQLTAGQTVSVALNGITLADPLLTIRNAAGAVLFTNDDGGPGLDSLLAFAAPTTGNYYIDVGSAPGNQTGTYQLSVGAYTLPPLGTIDQFADFLTSGFWNGDLHHFSVAPGGTITVNLTALTPEGVGLAVEALNLWSDVIGVTFQQVTGTAQITFDDIETGTGAFSDGVWANGITSSATVNVAPSRFGNGTGIARSGLQTYIHEIGHALGLGHAGDYNGGTAFSRYPYEALYLNDGAALSVMSYFDNGENTYYANQGFTNALLVTPQIADIAAVALLYGLSTTTRTGNTTYGFNNTSGREEFDASLHPGFSYTIIDSGGIDTLDYSGFGTSQRINLNPETFSNVGTSIGNVSIARGTVIENAIGGSGGDTLIGNSADNVLTGRAGLDNFTGGAGNDTFRDTAAGLNGDTIRDFTTGDKIVITDANPGSFAFSLSGNTLTYTGGSLTLANSPAGTLVASAATGGGVELQIIQRDAANDFDANGRSDILWLSDSGQLTDWLGTATGGFASNWANANATVPAGWHVAGTGDFNGDHLDDILLRHDDGRIADWLATAGGGFVDNSAQAGATVALNWQVVGTGDFNGDSIDDILWRSTSGEFSEWVGAASGGFVDNYPVAGTTVPTDWHIVGAGDFNGDGKDDILWRNDVGVTTDWLGTPNGSFTTNWANAGAGVPTDWHVAATGDFNGDGNFDVLWRNDNGLLVSWLGNASGGFAADWAHAPTGVGAEWQVGVIGDYNGDGIDDVLWRNTDGQLTEWLGSSTGAFIDNSVNAATFVGNNWHAEPHSSLL